MGKLLERLLTDGIQPHAGTIAQIVSDGGIAVVVFEPGPRITKVARQIGWDKYTAPVVRMPDAFRFDLAMADTGTRRWLKRPADGGGRLFVMSGDGTLLVNITERGFSLEPGSLDHERKAVAS